MGVLQRLSRLVAGGPAAAAKDALTDCYGGAVRRARLLEQHAELAPQAYGAEGLKALAAAEHEQVERLRQALKMADAPIPSVVSEPPAQGALNHWGRLVQDLEAHRSSMRRLRELEVHFAETLPATADLFDQLCREELHHCERLRALIARADPQALD